MKIGNVELDIVEDIEFVKKYIEECPIERQRTLLDNIAYDIVDHARGLVDCYSMAMLNKSRPTPKKCYTDLRKELLWLTKAQKVFQLARKKWQEGLKSQ